MGKRSGTLAVTVAVVVCASSGLALAAVITGNAGDNTLRGTDQADRLDGRAGDDTLLARKASDSLTGGRDDDRLNGGQTGGERYLFGDDWGNDTIADPAGRDVLNFSAANSGVFVSLNPSGDPEASTIDKLSTGTVNFPETVAIENVVGGSGEDSIYGTGGRNSLRGNGETDFIGGRAGNDSLGGGEGGDSYQFGDGWGRDTLTDTSGTDTLDFSNLPASATTSLVVNLGGPTATWDTTNTLNSGSTGSFVVIENAVGGADGDDIRGNSASNNIRGSAGDDTIRVGNDGAASPDTVDCGEGTNDTARIDSGVDTTVNCENIVPE